MTYPQVNRLFTLACFSLGPVLGSVVSFIWHGGALWCAFEIATGRRRLNRDGLVRWATLFLCIYACMMALSFVSNAPTLATAYKLLPLLSFLLFPFSYSIWSISRKDEIATAVVLASMAGCFGALAIALIQYFGLDIRAEGGAGNALVFAHVTGLAGITCLAGALTLDTRWTLPLLAAYLAAILAILFSESRSIWAIMLMVTAPILFYERRRLPVVFKGRFLLAACLVGLAVLLASNIILDRVLVVLDNWEKVTEHGIYRSSLGYRIALWQIALDLFAERPLIGHGLHRTTALIESRMAEDFALVKHFTHFHNGFLTLLVEGGIVALAAVLALFGLVARHAISILRRTDDPIRRLGAFLLLALMTFNILGGSVNIIFGHDILDTVFLIFLIVGAYLSAGTSMLTTDRSDPQDE